jgi:hypothetical protein
MFSMFLVVFWKFRCQFIQFIGHSFNVFPFYSSGLLGFVVDIHHFIRFQILF